MATNQTVKDFFASSGNNPEVSNTQLTKISDWLTEHKGLDAPATADDLVDYIYQTLREQVLAHRRRTSIVTF
jgi:hypothetical protein